MTAFDFPKNVKQIGGIDQSLRIYVEDYVMSYVSQYTTAAGYDERLGVFVGRRVTIDDLPVVLISGIILGKYAQEDEGRLVLTAKSHRYIEEQLTLHFRGLEVVGMMQSQPGYGTGMNPSYELDFLELYPEADQVFFVTDPLEKINAFYVQKGDRLMESKGYFVYYEKNEAMNHYMQENKIIKSLRVGSTALEGAIPQPSDVAAAAEIELEVEGKKERVFLGSKKKAVKFTLEDEPEEVLEEDASTMIQPPKLGKVSETRPKPKGTIKGQRRVTNILVTMTSVMLLISFVMAGAVIRAEDRMAQMETELGSLTSAYINIIQSLQATQEAFAMVNITQPGQGLVIEENGALPTPEASAQASNVFAPLGGNFPQTYVVQAGDNLLAISQMFYGTIGMVDAIKEMNDILNADMIFQGMVLQLPQPE